MILSPGGCEVGCCLQPHGTSRGGYLGNTGLQNTPWSGSHMRNTPVSNAGDSVYLHLGIF